MSDDLNVTAIRNMAGRVKDRHCEPGGDRSAYLLAIHAAKPDTKPPTKSRASRHRNPNRRGADHV